PDLRKLGEDGRRIGKMAPQQLNTCGKVAFLERANDEIHGLSMPPPSLLTKLVLLGPCSQGRPAVKSAGKGALASVSVCCCVNHEVASGTEKEGNRDSVWRTSGRFGAIT